MSGSVPAPVGAQRRRRRITRREREEFLEALRQGWTVTAAAEYAGHYRRRWYELAERDQEFAAAMRDAIEAGTDALVEEARRRAVDGWDEPVFRAGGLVGFVRKYSDALLMRLLASRDPSWREGAQVQVVNAIGPQVELDGPGAASLEGVFAVLHKAGAISEIPALPAAAPDVVDAEAVEVEADELQEAS